MTVAGVRLADRYVLTSELGAGGMGVVWKARDTRLERDVAIKLLNAGAIADDLARARLLREAKAAGGLQHDGIVRIYDAGESDDGGAYLVMELVSGKSLREALALGELTRHERIDVIVEIARALAVAHGAGILHRDVKPENVLIRRDKRPVLVDFGLAKPIPSGFAKTMEIGAASNNITMEGSVVGTPAYLAPEQVRGEEVGSAADQFALGVTAFELLTGRLPFEGTSVLAILAAVLHETPPLASSVCADVSEPVAEVIARAIRRAPSERFPSISAFADALVAASSDTTDGAPVVPSKPPTAAVTLPDATPDERERPTVPPARAATTRRRWVPFATIAVLGMVAGVGLRQLSSDKGPSATTQTSASAGALAMPADAVVACPLFKVAVDGVEEPSGWLAAAAADLTCERVQDLLGGSSARALGPADLAGLPRDATDHSAIDPFATAETRQRIDAAARDRNATVIGTVKKEPRDFVIDLAVNARDGREVARATGRGYELPEAVSSALRALPPGTFGDARASAFQKEWLRVDSREAAVDLRDVESGIIIEDDIATASACARVAKRTDVRPEMSYLLRAICQERLKRVALEEAPPPIDESSRGGLATTVAAHRARGGIEEVRKRVVLLENAAQQTEDAEERVILYATAAEVLYVAGDTHRAHALSRLALHASPKLVDVRGTPWHRVSFSGTFDSQVTRAHAAWIPWEPVAVQNVSSGDGTAPYLTRLKSMSRSSLLGRRGFFMSSYCEHLTRAGRLVEAEGIADQLDNDMLRVRVLIGRAQYKAALTRGTAVLAALPASDEKAGTAFRLASSLAEASYFVGKPASFVDDVVARYVDVEPPHVKIGVVPFVGLVHACSVAPSATAKRCIHRLKQLFERGDLGGLISTAPTILEGAERWVAGDVEGAAKTWRPLARQISALEIEALHNVMTEAFDRTGMLDLAAKLDADILALVDQPGAMDPAFVRGASRAEKQGDFVTARKLATAALEKWQTADEDVPLSRDMKALLKRLEGR